GPSRAAGSSNYIEIGQSSNWLRTDRGTSLKASRRQARHIHNPDRVRGGQRHDLQQFVDAAAHFERILGNLRSKHRNVVIIEIAAESGRWAALLSNSDKSGIQVQPDCERC